MERLDCRTTFARKDTLADYGTIFAATSGRFRMSGLINGGRPILSEAEGMPLLQFINDNIPKLNSRRQSLY